MLSPGSSTKKPAKQSEEHARAESLIELDALRKQDTQERRDQVMQYLRKAVADLQEDEWMFKSNTS
ncbi:MAG: hypothetical protein SGCHY_003788 [Lobulomycetales sp.]